MSNAEWIFQRPFWKNAKYLSNLLTVGKVCAEKTATEQHDVHFGIGYSSSAKGEHPNVEVWCGIASLLRKNDVNPLVFLFYGNGFKPFNGTQLQKDYSGRQNGYLRWGEFNSTNVPVTLPYNDISERVKSLGYIPKDDPDLLEELTILDIPPSKKSEFQKSREDIGRESAERWKRIAGFGEIIRNLQNNVCAVCACDIAAGLQGAHILEVRDKGTEDSDNGLCLCYQHHAYWDKGLFIIRHCEGDKIVVKLPKQSPYSLEKLEITKYELARFLNTPKRVEMLKERERAREKRNMPSPSTQV